MESNTESVTENKNEQLWTMKQASEFLNINYHTLRNQVDSGKVPFILVDKGTRKRIIRFNPAKLKAHYGITD